jgi:hypothetical protein
MGLMGRLLAAFWAASALTAGGVGAMYVTTAPKWVSLAIEPVSLFLLPGLVVSLAIAGPHDFSPLWVAAASDTFYFALFYWLFSRWDRRASAFGHGSR